MLVKSFDNHYSMFIMTRSGLIEAYKSSVATAELGSWNHSPSRFNHSEARLQ